MNSTTFKVDDTVSSPKGPLTTTTAQKLWADLRETKVEGFGMNTNLPLVRSHMNPFVDAVYRSYAQHYPLVLSPDDVWVAIAQGFATHVNENAEALRNRFVSHKGKKLLHLDLPGFAKGSDSNPWDTVLGKFSNLIAENIGPEQRNLVVSAFTTTGPIENEWVAGVARGHHVGPTTNQFPVGMTKVPWKWEYLGGTFNMEFLGGFLAYAQDPETLALRPVLAWAVRDPSSYFHRRK